NSILTLTNLSTTNAGTYSVEVSGACRSATNSATLTINTAITASALTNQTACVGLNATFNTAVSGTGPYTFVWKKGGSLLAGQTTNSLSFTNLMLSDADLYSVEVSGACNTVTNSASLIVNTNLTITPLSSLVVCPSNTATFSTIASGTGPFGYVWRKDGTLISGQNGSNLTFVSVTASNAATYTVEVTGACSKATNSATLTVGSSFTATALTNQTVCSCQAVTFTTTVTGSGTYSFVWKKDGQTVFGQNTNFLYLQGLSTNDSGTYSVEITGLCGSITKTATLTVEPEILVNPLIITNSSYITMAQNKANPYPSAINVKCLFGTVQKLIVTLHDFSHAFPDDIDSLLVGPNGKAIKIMSDTGGGETVNNLTLAFDEFASDFLSDTDQLFSGTYKPTDYPPADSFPAPAPAPNAALLSEFIGSNPNGPWSLYVVDDVSLDNGSIAGGWSLQIYYDVIAPTLSSPKTRSDGKLEFLMTAEPTITHVIESSTDLQNWTPISTNTLSGPTLIFVDSPPAGQYACFYRAVRRGLRLGQ
ncbi:MAG: hypothetical protein ABIP71_07515, partial [Verrucomicrobiota bacterium]